MLRIHVRKLAHIWKPPLQNPGYATDLFGSGYFTFHDVVWTGLLHEPLVSEIIQHHCEALLSSS